MRFAFVAALGTALAAKFLLESHGGAETQEVDLVSIFGGEHLVSSADPFYGGKILTMFGGTLLDLRKAAPAPTGIYLDIAIVMGGLSLVVPSGWRVEYDGTAFAGGFDDATQTTADPDAPVVRVGGYVVMGGFRATTRSPVEAVV
jgi:hypothetical protein